MKLNDTFKALFCLFGFGLNLSSAIGLWHLERTRDIAFIFTSAATAGCLAYLLKVAISTAIIEAASALFAEGELTLTTKQESNDED